MPWEPARCGVLRPSWRKPLSRPGSWARPLPTVPEGAGWKDLPGRARGWEGLGDLGWAGRGRKRPHSSHRHGPPRVSGAPRPPSPTLLQARPGGQTSQPGVPSPGWTCLWSGRGPWQPQPCGPGSPWLLRPFAPCPRVLSGSPCSLTVTAEVSSHPSLASVHRPFSRPSHPHMEGGGCQGPAGAAPPSPGLPASAESPCVWEAPRAQAAE